MWKEREKIQKRDYLENEKSFLDEIKSNFHIFEMLSFGKILGKQLIFVNINNKKYCLLLAKNEKLVELSIKAFHDVVQVFHR